MSSGCFQTLNFVPSPQIFVIIDFRLPCQKYRHQHKSTFDCFRLFLGASGGRNGWVLCGILFPSKLDHCDHWSRLGGPPMITFRFLLFAPGQLLVRADYLDPTLVSKHIITTLMHLALLVRLTLLVLLVLLVRVLAPTQNIVPLSRTFPFVRRFNKQTICARMRARVCARSRLTSRSSCGTFTYRYGVYIRRFVM
jgi:hypothetical protein